MLMTQSCDRSLKVKDDVLQDLKDNPFRPSENTNAGLLNSSQFLTASDFENIQAKLNYKKIDKSFR